MIVTLVSDSVTLSAGCVTVTSTVVFFPLPSVAAMVILQVPLLTPVIWPFWSTVAIFGLEEVKVTFWLVALRGSMLQPIFTTVSTSRLTLLCTSAIFVTGCCTTTEQAAAALPFSWLTQVMTQVPGATGVILPEELTVAIPSLLEIHVTFLLFALEGRMVSVSVLVEPMLTVTLLSDRVRPVTGWVTVTLTVVDFLLPSAAVMVMFAVPFDTPVTTPF